MTHQHKCTARVHVRREEGERKKENSPGGSFASQLNHIWIIRVLGRSWSLGFRESSSRLISVMTNRWRVPRLRWRRRGVERKLLREPPPHTRQMQIAWPCYCQFVVGRGLRQPRYSRNARNYSTRARATRRGAASLALENSFANSRARGSRSCIIRCNCFELWCARVIYLVIFAIQSLPGWIVVYFSQSKFAC